MGLASEWGYSQDTSTDTAAEHMSTKYIVQSQPVKCVVQTQKTGLNCKCQEITLAMRSHFLNCHLIVWKVLSNRMETGWLLWRTVGVYL